MEVTLISRNRWFSRRSSERRIATGTVLGGKRYVAYASGNFALSTALLHEFSSGQAARLIGKYLFSGLCLSFPFFTVNEILTTSLKTLEIDNFFLSYSLSSLVIMPFFVYSQRVFRGLGHKESRFLGYRYIGTICCVSLAAEALLAIYKNYQMGNFTETNVKELITINR